MGANGLEPSTSRILVFANRVDYGWVFNPSLDLVFALFLVPVIPGLGSGQSQTHYFYSRECKNRVDYG